MFKIVSKKRKTRNTNRYIRGSIITADEQKSCRCGISSTKSRRMQRDSYADEDNWGAQTILTYLRTELSPSREAANCATIQEIPSNFKEPEGSSPYSQEPSTGPYPEPDRSSPHHPILSLWRSILILSTHLRLGLPSGLFPSGFPTDISVHYNPNFCVMLKRNCFSLTNRLSKKQIGTSKVVPVLN
jgi:hypothetical protein